MAQFLDLELTDDLRDMVLERTSREFMHDHKDKFDDLMVCQVLEERCGVPAASDSSKVQSEGSKADAVPSAIAEQIDAMWAERVEPVTGHANFASLAAEVDGLQDQ